MKDENESITFDQNLIPLALSSTEACEEVLVQLRNYEKRFKVRQRARKKTDKVIFEETISCLNGKDN